MEIPSTDFLYREKVDGFTRVILGTKSFHLTRALPENREGFHSDRLFQTMKEVKRHNIDALTERDRSCMKLTEPDLSSFGTEIEYL